jgi:hypothetical protein
MAGVTAFLKMTLALLACALAMSAWGCAGPANPASLWVSHGEREVDLVLIDHEPPPY